MLIFRILDKIASLQVTIAQYDLFRNYSNPTTKGGPTGVRVITRIPSTTHVISR